jgi:hypothetical protein
MEDPSGWWEGSLEGRSGLFPMNFVEIISDPRRGGFLIGETFEIDGRYAPTVPGHLVLDVGDIVFVRSIADGWCTGYNITTGSEGQFPARIVRYLRNLRLN